jgi:amino acid transporter
MKEERTRKKKPMGLWTAVSIGIGGMVGAGIFSILGIAADISGNAMYLSFVIAGIVAFLSAYSFAKLGAKYPSAGGPVEFLVRGFGDGILSGGFNIVLWIGYVFVLALYAKAFGGYASTFLSANIPGKWPNIIATSIILLFTAVNFIGAKAVGRAEFFIVAVKLAVLLMFVAVGFFYVKPSLLSVSQWPQISRVFFGAGIVFVAYEGFGLITNAAEDMDNPKKTLPRALYLSVAIVIIIYSTICLTVLGNLSLAKIIDAKEYALAAAADPFLGSIGFKIVAIAALFSTASAINATLYGGTNVSYTIAKNGELPRFFERKVWGRSPEGLFLTAGLVIAVVNLFNLEGVALLGSASFLIIYAAVNLAHLRLYKETGADPYIIGLAILGCLGSFGVLMYHEIKNSPMAVAILGAVFCFSFIAEAGYRSYTNRRLKTRAG